MRSHPKETTPIRSRPQYHYFYGSTNGSRGDLSESSAAGTDTDTVLLGECLVQTDNEEETPNSSAQDLRHLVVTKRNGHSRIKHAYQLEIPIPETQKGRRSSHPVGHVTRIIVLLVSAISVGTCILVLLPNSPATSTGAAYSKSSFIPYQMVDKNWGSEHFKVQVMESIRFLESLFRRVHSGQILLWNLTVMAFPSL
jgi:hypothetical protein